MDPFWLWKKFSTDFRVFHTDPQALFREPVEKNTKYLKIKVLVGVKLWKTLWKTLWKENLRLFQGTDEVVDQAVEITLALIQFSDFGDAVQHGRVVFATKIAPDFRQAVGGQLLAQVHGDLAWNRDIA